jgi:hypothetical protein
VASYNRGGSSGTRPAPAAVVAPQRPVAWETSACSPTPFGSEAVEA